MAPVSQRRRLMHHRTTVELVDLLSSDELVDLLSSDELVDLLSSDDGPDVPRAAAA